MCFFASLSFFSFSLRTQDGEGVNFRRECQLSERVSSFGEGVNLKRKKTTRGRSRRSKDQDLASSTSVGLTHYSQSDRPFSSCKAGCAVQTSQLMSVIDSQTRGTSLGGYHGSRRCSRDTYPESYITKYTSIRRKVRSPYNAFSAETAVQTGRKNASATTSL